MKIELKVFPSSGREEFIKTDKGIKAYIKAAPEEGKANSALIALIAKSYKVKKSEVKIIKGKTSRNKVVEIGRD